MFWLYIFSFGSVEHDACRINKFITMKKKYLITYADRTIERPNVMSILGVPEARMKKSEEFNLANSIEDDESIVHFDKMGVSLAGLSDQEKDDLSNKSEILSIEEDLEMHILGFASEAKTMETVSTASANLWNIELVKAPEAWANGITGAGVKLAIVDTGIAAHPDLVIAGGVSCVPNVSSYNDGNGHGTHCAGTAAGRNGLNKVYGVAKDCSLYAVKVLADSGSGATSSVISGLEWCAQNKMQVASLSLGSSSNPSVAYAAAIKNCQDNGVTVVCASGNEYQSNFPWVASPANSFTSGDVNASPVAVGAVDRNSLIAYFSSRGTNTDNWNPVTVVAPGVDVYSTWLDNGYNTLNGTSMACPHVAGLAALIIQKLGAVTPSQVNRKYLQLRQTLVMRLILTQLMDMV